MKFLSITIENFSSYYGKHVITFNTSKDKPVSIIIGGGGYGKTSIFDAINWALYGKQYEQTLKNDFEKTIIDYINETALQEANINGLAVEMACTLVFEHEDIKYRIQQAICVKKMERKVL
jgi:DNA sulfur modification protein DndD